MLLLEVDVALLQSKLLLKTLQNCQTKHQVELQQIKIHLQNLAVQLSTTAQLAQHLLVQLNTMAQLAQQHLVQLSQDSLAQHLLVQLSTTAQLAQLHLVQLHLLIAAWLLMHLHKTKCTEIDNNKCNINKGLPQLTKEQQLVQDLTEDIQKLHAELITLSKANVINC